MALGIEFYCNKCNFSITAWDDGNPYIIYPIRKRNYFYHPSGIDSFIEKLKSKNLSEKEINNILENGVYGNAPDHICLECGKIYKIDPEVDKIECKKCKSKNIIDLVKLKGKKCPFCGGKFIEDKDNISIS